MTHASHVTGSGVKTKNGYHVVGTNIVPVESFREIGLVLKFGPRDREKLVLMACEGRPKEVTIALCRQCDRKS